jgi:hypothetical protein
MKVEVCHGGAQNPFLLTQPGYTDQRIQFVKTLFKQSLIAVGIAHRDLEQGQELVEFISSAHTDSFSCVQRQGNHHHNR